MSKQAAVIYGIGTFYKNMEVMIGDIYEVAALSDQNADLSKNIMPLTDALMRPYDVVVLMIMNLETCYDAIGMLIKEYKVPYYKIKLGLNLVENKGWDCMDINSDGNIVFQKGKVSLVVGSTDELNNILEIFCGNCYGYFIDDRSREVILDIGMNIGGGCLYFLERQTVVKVYGFEPFQDTFMKARENFERNGLLEDDRLEYFPYGISDCDEIRTVIYNKNMSCGQSTNSEINSRARKQYQEWGLISDNDDKVAEVEVRDIGAILAKIYEKHKEEKVILKIDCEGEEQRIMFRLEREDLLKRVTIIMLEWHWGQEDSLIGILKRNDYTFWNFRHENNTGGLIYAVRRTI